MARPPIILSVVLARTVRVVAVGVMFIATSGCTGELASVDPCPTPTPMASPWPEYVVDLQVPNGVLIDVGVFGDGRETVGQWSISSVDLGSTADVLRQSLVTQGFTLEGSFDSTNIAYGTNDTGQVIDIQATPADVCDRVVITVDSIAATQPDPPT